MPIILSNHLVITDGGPRFLGWSTHPRIGAPLSPRNGEPGVHQSQYWWTGVSITGGGVSTNPVTPVAGPIGTHYSGQLGELVNSLPSRGHRGSTFQMKYQGLEGGSLQTLCAS